MNHPRNVKKTCLVNSRYDEKNTQANIQTLMENVNIVSRHNTSVKRQSSVTSPSLQAAWADIQATCTENAGLTITEQISYVGNYTGTLPSGGAVDFSGATIAADGKIYLAPSYVNDLPIFTPETQQYMSAGTPVSGTGAKFGSAVYAMSTNAVYYFPYYYGKVLKYSLNSQILTPMEDLTGYWNYGTLAPNNCIYAVSHKVQNNLLKLDLATETFTYLSIPFGSFSSMGFRVAPNGKLYAAPCDGTYVLCLDPITDTMTQFGSLSTLTRKWLKCVLAPNGYMYAMPCRYGKILKIDYINQQASEIHGIDLGFNANQLANAAGLAPNGKIYSVPGTLTNIIIFDPLTEQLTYGSDTVAMHNYNGYCVGLDGYLYITPRDGARTIIKLDAGANVCRNFSQDTLLSPLLN